MKKNWLKICLPAFVLMGMMSLTVSASMEAAVSAEGNPSSAQENGYWVTKVDDAGETVRIFVYTEPVKWEIREDADLGRCNMDGSETPTPSAERIAGVGQAEARLAETPAEPEIVPAAGLAETDGDALAGTESVLFFIALVGVLALAGLGYALYRAV